MKSSLEELERVCVRLDKELKELREEFEEFKYSRFEAFKDNINERLDLRNDLTQQNGMAIQTLSTRMDNAGLPK